MKANVGEKWKHVDSNMEISDQNPLLKCEAKTPSLTSQISLSTLQKILTVAHAQNQAQFKEITIWLKTADEYSNLQWCQQN